MRRDPATRRRFLSSAVRLGGLAGVGLMAGCQAQGDAKESVPGAAATVEVDPDGSLRFVPSEVAILKGETVVWTFENAGHNISAHPGHGAKVSIPDDAEPFTTYENGNTDQTVPPGDRFSHTFETTGDYQYVCLHHGGEGMVGTVMVE